MTKLTVNQFKTLLAIIFSVILFFASIVTGFIIFEAKHIGVKIGFGVLILISTYAILDNYRRFSGSNNIYVEDDKLIIKKSWKTERVNLSDIHKFDLSKGKFLKGDDVLKIVYEKKGKMVKTVFSLFFFKESSEEIYKNIVSHLENLDGSKEVSSNENLDTGNLDTENIEEDVSSSSKEKETKKKSVFSDIEVI